MSAKTTNTETQLSFDELGTPLRTTTFVVFDLETTGGSAEQDAITEIGAVKVCGGEVVGEFATLVDPGRGIPPDIASRVFSPFFTTKEPGKGTGLGLSLVSNVARAHGGSIALDPYSPHTRFVLALPIVFGRHAR